MSRNNYKMPNDIKCRPKLQKYNFYKNGYIIRGNIDKVKFVVNLDSSFIGQFFHQVDGDGLTWVECLASCELYFNKVHGNLVQYLSNHIAIIIE